MHFVQRLVAASVAAASCAASACNWPTGTGTDGGAPASGGSAPSAAVIDSLDVTSNAQSINNQYNVTGSISFHDAEVPVHLLRVRIPVLGMTKTFDYPAGDQSTVTGASFDVVVSSDPPLGGAGPTNFLFTLVDKDGAESSPPVEKSVDLQ
jgi:predicted small secreted protein